MTAPFTLVPLLPPSCALAPKSTYGLTFAAALRPSPSYHSLPKPGSHQRSVNVKPNKHSLPKFHCVYPLSTWDISNNSGYYLLSACYVPGHFAISSLCLRTQTLVLPQPREFTKLTPNHTARPRQMQDSNPGMSVQWIRDGCPFSVTPPLERWSLFSSPSLWAVSMICSE